MHNRQMFDWNDLKYLLAVARAGSTLAAAKSLGVNQSTVHRRLQELEKRLGCELVKRHPTGYRLTEAGQRVLAHAERVEQAAEEFQRAISAASTDMTGTVRVTCPEALAPRLIGSGIIEKFNQRYPEIRVEFVMSDKILDLGSEADIAIRAKLPIDGALVGRKIADTPWALYGSRSYVGRSGNVNAVGDIDRHSVVIFAGPLKDHQAAQWLRSVAPNAHVAARAESLAALLLSVKSGAGLTPLPMVVGDNEEGLTPLLDLGPALTTPFYLLMHQDLRRSPRVRAFFDFVVENLDVVRPLLVPVQGG